MVTLAVDLAWVVVVLDDFLEIVLVVILLEAPSATVLLATSSGREETATERALAAELEDDSRHWEYQGMKFVQVHPTSLHVDPLKEEPPHCWYAPEQDLFSRVRVVGSAFRHPPDP